MNKIKVLIADDHAIVRQGLKQVLAEAPDMEVGAEATNGMEALEQIRKHDWDVALLDMSMPGRNGIELIKLAKAEKPKMPILVLTMHSEDQYAVRALQAGASGYLTKESAPEQLVNAIRKVASGGVYVSASTAEKLAKNLMPSHEALPHTLLSSREFEIFQMLTAGISLSEAAEKLSLSVKTISTHKTHILQKMNLANQTELVRYAVKHGLVDEPDPSRL
ncbi:MAG: response regulator transcription factor [Burkholderiales bacterium]